MSEIISLSRPEGIGMLSLRADLDKASEDIRKVTDLPVPDPLGSTAEGAQALVWFAPDELLYICPEAARAEHHKALKAALAKQHHLLADVSDMRAVFALVGEPGVLRAALAKLTPIDLRPTAFAPGQVRRTQLGQVAAALWWRAEGDVWVMCFRSVEGYVEGLLRTACDPVARVEGVFSD